MARVKVTYAANGEINGGGHDIFTVVFTSGSKQRIVADMCLHNIADTLSDLEEIKKQLILAQTTIY